MDDSAYLLPADKPLKFYTNKCNLVVKLVVMLNTKGIPETAFVS